MTVSDLFQRADRWEAIAQALYHSGKGLDDDAASQDVQKWAVDAARIAEGRAQECRAIARKMQETS